MQSIGSLIKEKLLERNKTVVWFSKELGCSRTNVYKIFERTSVDTDDLCRISLILGYDFFKIYSEELSRQLKKNKG
ncbi:MAG: XRE family transcriptional regulator [Prevotella sp.]|jgi:hypothetical protein|nr:XRE family transcriptional regulator [Prevotella sp.]MBQ6186496.1 XRE family transcriptional regulator [Prevotella sp.]